MITGYIVPQAFQLAQTKSAIHAMTACSFDTITLVTTPEWISIYVSLLDRDDILYLPKSRLWWNRLYVGDYVGIACDGLYRLDTFKNILWNGVSPFSKMNLIREHSNSKVIGAFMNAAAYTTVRMQSEFDLNLLRGSEFNINES